MKNLKNSLKQNNLIREIKMIKQKQKNPIRLTNSRTGEMWLCRDLSKIKIIEGNEFVEVYKEGSSRTFLISKKALTKVK